MTSCAKFKLENIQYLVSRYMPHEDDPTVLGVVANEKDVYIAGVADQRIEHGNRFTGSTYPSKLPPDIITTLGELTRKAGKWLAANGYRGIFGCDYIVNATKKIFTFWKSMPENREPPWNFAAHWSSPCPKALLCCRNLNTGRLPATLFLKIPWS
jgi:hypothetical protein